MPATAPSTDRVLNIRNSMASLRVLNKQLAQALQTAHASQVHSYGALYHMSWRCKVCRLISRAIQFPPSAGQARASEGSLLQNRRRMGVCL